MVAALSFQLFGFAVSIAAGFLLGALYDVLRIWRDFLHSQRRAVFFQDFFYMVLCAFFTFLLALALSDGAVRFYLLAGEAVGWFVYYFTVGQVTSRLFRLLSGLLYRYVFDPLGRLLKRGARWLRKKAKIFTKSLKKRAADWKKRLKHRGKLVYNRHNRIHHNRIHRIGRKRKVVRKNEGARKAKT